MYFVYVCYLKSSFYWTQQRRCIHQGNEYAGGVTTTRILLCSQTKDSASCWLGDYCSHDGGECFSLTFFQDDSVLSMLAVLTWDKTVCNWKTKCLNMLVGQFTCQIMSSFDILLTAVTFLRMFFSAYEKCQRLAQIDTDVVSFCFGCGQIFVDSADHVFDQWAHPAV